MAKNAKQPIPKQRPQPVQPNRGLVGDKMPKNLK